MKRDNTMTRRYLADAGIAQGMRVIELGCGGGEITEILAELVGPAGTVVALDRNRDMLALARDRMQERGIGHVQFLCVDAAGDLSALAGLGAASFDALAGRRVLMYLPDPAEVLRRFAAWLRDGGLVVFEETDASMVPARTAAMPAHDQVMGWLKGMLAAEGANTTMGFDLPAAYARAGLRPGRVRAEAVIQGQGTQYPLAELLQLVQSRVISAGIATPAEVDAAAARLAAESSDPTRVYISEMSFCAWAYKG